MFLTFIFFPQKTANQKTQIEIGKKSITNIYLAMSWWDAPMQITTRLLLSRAHGSSQSQQSPYIQSSCTKLHTSRSMNDSLGNLKEFQIFARSLKEREYKFLDRHLKVMGSSVSHVASFHCVSWQPVSFGIILLSNATLQADISITF